MANRWGHSRNSDRLFPWAPKSLQMVTAAMKLEDNCTLGEKYDKSRQHFKKHHFRTTICLVKPVVFPVVMYGCENWTIKEAEHQRTDVFELWCGEDS